MLPFFFLSTSVTKEGWLSRRGVEFEGLSPARKCSKDVRRVCRQPQFIYLGFRVSLSMNYYNTTVRTHPFFRHTVDFLWGKSKNKIEPYSFLCL